MAPVTTTGAATDIREEVSRKEGELEVLIRQ
jgi:hypothetical protein